MRVGRSVWEVRFEDWGFKMSDGRLSVVGRRDSADMISML